MYLYQNTKWDYTYITGGDNPMENLKVKSKVHDPPNLIPGIDLMCFAKKTHTFGQKKSLHSHITC